MSTPEHPATPPLTRKQLRELRNTGATPVINADSPNGTEPAEQAPAAPANAAPLPRPAEPAPVPPPPVADSSVDLGVSPLTRRQARQQEKIRTASVPVITPEIIAAHAAGAGAAPFAAPAAQPQHPVFAPPEDESPTVATDSGMHSLFGLPRTDDEQSEPEASVWARAEEGAEPSTTDAEAPDADEFDVPMVTDDTDHTDSPAPFGAFADEAQADGSDDDAKPKAVVSPTLGAGLLGGDSAAPAPVAAAELPASFDQLLTRTTGSVAVPNALIVSQAPEVSPLVGPITATGEVLVTGTYNLPEGLGSTGHAKGTADGKEIDATLVDGELPSHSSPTPIAASAAVSTVKMPGEVIRPPAPEKGSRLMMTLAITAGVLAIALVGVLILAFATGALG